MNYLEAELKDKLLLIDGHSILNRAFYGVPDFTNSEGLHTNAVYGFLNILFKFLDQEQPQYLAVAFDLSAPTFRHKMFTEYKGTRKPMLPELREQVPLIKEVLTSMNVKICELEGFEADDVLGTLGKRAESEGLEVTIVSGDRDLLQLATENIKISIPKTKKGATEVENYYFKDVVEKYGVTPTEFIDMKALMGDTSDNIPGVPGIGEKGAGKIILEYHSIENAYEHVDEISNSRNRESLKEHYELAQLSKTLATINIECPVNVSMEECKHGDMFTSDAFAIIKRLEFKSMFSRFENVESDNHLEEFFHINSDFNEVEELFQKCAVADNCGLFINRFNGIVYGASICYEEDKVTYIPVEGFISADYLCEKIASLSHNCKGLTLLNIKAVQDILNADEYCNLFDTGIAAYLINPLKDTYDYDDIARDFLGMQIPSFTEIFPSLKKSKFDQVNDEELAQISRWCCYSAYVLYKAKDKLVEELNNMNMMKLYSDIEFPLVFALYDMEKTGVKVKKQALKEYGDRLSASIDIIQVEIYNEVGEEFNINSPKQLGVILFEKLGLPFGKKTKTGYSTSADILEKLQPDYPIVGKILEYRQLTKLKSTYADGLAQYIRDDGRIHGQFNQTITATGRISSTEPNLQNIPVRMQLGREIRKVFVPKEGCIFIDADYSQIELRILASMSEDDALIQSYKEAKDIHQATASKVFNVPIEQVTKTQRNNAKAVNFGIVYGISSFGLSQDLSISRKEAEQYIKDYFESYPNVKKFLDDTVNNAKNKGYTVTLFNRRRPIPELKSGNFMQRSFGERAAMNSPIQGTAADIMKIAALNVYRKLKENGLKSKIVLQVHDELLVETYIDEKEQVKNILEQEMKGAADLKVALDIGMSEGSNWYEAH